MSQGKAQRYNERASRRLWKHRDLPNPWVNLTPGSEAFFEATKAFQKLDGLTCDGMLGPKTLAGIKSTMEGGAVPYKPPTKRPVPASDESPSIAIDCETYKATKTKSRRKQPEVIVLHDSVTRSAKSCFSVLEKRGLSTHYMIDEDGTIYQCADPSTRTTAHASAWNSRSIGIDMINLLSPRPLKKNSSTDDKRRKRMTTRSWSASKDGRVIDYTKEQKASLSLLISHLCDAYGIKRTAPKELTSYGKKLELNANKYLGIVAHGQASSKRWDGLLAVEILHEEGYEAC